MKKLTLLLVILISINLVYALNGHDETEGNDSKVEADVFPFGGPTWYCEGIAETGSSDWFIFQLYGQDVLEAALVNPGIEVVFYREDDNMMDVINTGENSGGFTASQASTTTLFNYYMEVRNGSDQAYTITLTNTTNNTLPVTLSSFNAVNTAEGTVELNWIVQSETEMLGYNLLRNETDTQETAVNINSNPIPALNLPNEHSYSFSDIDVDVNSTYYYWIESIEINNNATYHGPVKITVMPEDEEEDAEHIKYTKINKNFPNPFNPHTVISYDLSGYKDTKVPVSLYVYNIRGQKVATLIDGYETPGKGKTIDWYGKDDNGNNCSSGVYFYVLKTQETVVSSKMTLLK